MVIEIISNTAASGVVLLRGDMLNVPDDISISDAKTLMALHRAVEVIEQPRPSISSIDKPKKEKGRNKK